ncbi:hypothetical protein PVK06_049896 [Gossypium arboreum]|uniref:Uncharacterized protein n=1 Tax=Gossypium arboreum TaxID=29729 RepID=A0ABR0M9N8_GOSAR|nr:hypothetical protein PVK06_049896 [Gossypium arboreum]
MQDASGMIGRTEARAASFPPRPSLREGGPHTESHTYLSSAGDWGMGRVNSPGAEKITDEALQRPKPTL